MEPDNLLAHKMDVRGPVLLIIVVALVAVAQGGDVVAQGVHPDIDHMLGVKVHRYTPGKAGAGDAQVLQSGLDEVVHHFVDAGLRLQETGVVLIELQKAVGIFGQAEEIGLLLRVSDLPAAVGAFAVHQLSFGPEGFAGGAVFSLIGPLIDFIFIIKLFENFPHRFLVVIVGSADKAVLGDIHQLPQLLNSGDHLVNILLGGNARLLGLLLYLLTVLVGAG